MSAAVSNALSFVGPICWTVLVFRARWALRHAKRLEASAAKSYASSRETLDHCNAELLQSQMLRRWQERQASTCCSTVASGEEAPV